MRFLTFVRNDEGFSGLSFPLGAQIFVFKLSMTECFPFTLSVMSTEMETSYINGQLIVDN